MAVITIPAEDFSNHKLITFNFTEYSCVEFDKSWENLVGDINRVDNRNGYADQYVLAYVLYGDLQIRFILNRFNLYLVGYFMGNSTSDRPYGTPFILGHNDLRYKNLQFDLTIEELDISFQRVFYARANSVNEHNNAFVTRGEVNADLHMWAFFLSESARAQTCREASHLMCSMGNRSAPADLNTTHRIDRAIWDWYCIKDQMIHYNSHSLVIGNWDNVAKDKAGGDDASEADIAANRRTMNTINNINNYFRKRSIPEKDVLELKRLGLL